MSTQKFIQIRGAREHNLKNVSLNIPRNQLVVITGLSGSGKSSLAFDTIYAEGQRRYLESLSSYARQFLEKMKKPEVDYISGLSPTISIEQKSTTHNPRSTVGTTTEIYDYLRLLYSKLGSRQVATEKGVTSSMTLEQVCEEVLNEFKDKEVRILSPLVRGKKGEFQKLFEDVLKKGFSQCVVDDKEVEIVPNMKLRKSYRHDISVIIDHLVIQKAEKHFWKESLEMAAQLSDGDILICLMEGRKKKEAFFSIRDDGMELSPNMFSFNSPYGACGTCKGLGKTLRVEKSGLIVKPEKGLMSGALNKEIFFSFNKYFIEDLLSHITDKYQFEWSCPFQDWPEEAREAFFWGDDECEGLIDELRRLLHESKSEVVRRKVRAFLHEDVCPDCKGKRLKPESLSIVVQGKNIVELTEQSILDAVAFFQKMKFPKHLQLISDPILKEIRERLSFLEKVGLGYLSLDRQVATLSGGELQRIRLASQIGVGLTGVLYVLDEPSIGLHPRDNNRLIDSMKKLRDMKNTVLVVEHDEDMMREADHLIDLGPGAGVEGGLLVAEGHVNNLKGKTDVSETANYLWKTRGIHFEKNERKKVDFNKSLVLSGCQENNLKNVEVKIPLGALVCVTGVSGSGKSTLVHDTLYKELHNRLWKTNYSVGKFETLEGMEKIDKVIEIDQSPIGRTPRSNPVTYIDLFVHIRKLFAALKESKLRNYKISRFSFNLKGGRCEPCKGEGQQKLQMSFMPDVYVPCEFCGGKRYNAETLEVYYRGKNISDVLNMSVSEAVEFFDSFSLIQEKLIWLEKLGLGYIKLGQSSTTLSGGEAQRVKLASELCKRATGKTLYLLDEPTTGLHFSDVKNLMKALLELRNQGNTVMIIEHNMDVISSADYIIDLGPEGGAKGGKIVASGPPEKVAQSKRSYTGQYLRNYLNNLSKRDS